MNYGFDELVDEKPHQVRNATSSVGSTVALLSGRPGWEEYPTQNREE